MNNPSSSKNTIIFPDGVRIVLTDDTESKENRVNIERLRAKIGEYICDSDLSSLIRVRKEGSFTSPDGIIVSQNTKESIERIESVIKEKERIYSTGTNIESEMEKIINEYIRCYIPESIANGTCIQATHTELPLLEGLSNKDADDESVPEEGVTESSANNGEFESDIYLFQGTTICKGKANLLYADAGERKTLFSFEIATCGEIKKPLFIMLDDPSGE
jgi:hypothetical protein